VDARSWIGVNDSVALSRLFHYGARRIHTGWMETLGFKYLYAIKGDRNARRWTSCARSTSSNLDRTKKDLEHACVVEASKAGLRAEGYGKRTPRLMIKTSNASCGPPHSTSAA